VVQEDGTEIMCVDEASLSDYMEDPERYKRAMTHMSHLIKLRSDDYVEVCKTIYEMKGAGKPQGGLLERIKKFVSVSKKSDSKEAISAERARLDASRVIMSDVDDAFADGKAIEKSYADGTILFKEGEMGDCMYYVTNGAVGIYSAYGTESERRLARLTPGMIFGEIGLLEKIPRTATAVAIEGGAAVKLINERYLTEVMPVLAKQTLKYLSSRLRAVTNDYLLACEAVSSLENEKKGLGEPDEDTQKRINEYVIFAKAFVE
jgi:CRP-like cAMP-binding protein